MHPSPSDASPALPAFALALAILGVFTVIGGQVVGQMRMAPSTLLAVGAQAAVASPNHARAPVSLGASTMSQVEAGPGWGTLSTPQKLALYPLAERWARISEPQKRRWLALAANFSALPESEQAKFHERMTDWASLSAQQRNQARLNYAVTNRLAPSDKRAQWEAYQALSEDEKRALAARAAPKPKGAATALQPVSPQKLAQVPAAKEATPNSPNAPKIPPVADHATRMAAPVPLNPAPSYAPAPIVVETAPISMPVAVPAALPPLEGSSAESSPAAAQPPAALDTSDVYRQ